MKWAADRHTSNVSKGQSSATRDLMILFSVPIAVLLLAAAVVYGPRLAAHPQQSFLYVVCSNYGRTCGDNYTISTEGVLEDQTAYDMSRNSDSLTLRNMTYDTNDQGVLYYYDMVKESSKRLTLDEAQQYTLDKDEKSSDGYRLAQYSNEGGVLFWGTRSSGWQLENGLLKKHVILAGDDYDDKEFIGWVK